MSKVLPGYGGIEAGGTKFCCIVASPDGGILARARIDTTTPDATIPRVIEFFAKHPVRAAGLACFGPIDIDRASATYGYITNTPKRAWIQYNILGELKRAMPVPIGFHTDVVGAALAEQRWGAGIGKDSILYITVGTGIGGGFVYKQKPLDTAFHGELGHVFVARDPKDTFAGVCPYHADCLEGLASGPAIETRWGVRAESLPEAHPAWELEARYLALAIVNFIFTLAPARIVLGGGVFHKEGLIERVRENVIQQIGGYGSFGELTPQMNEYIVKPALGDDSGALGGVALAMDAAK
ncbi:MAG: ROK family protein [Planctomycetota bacterium]